MNREQDVLILHEMDFCVKRKIAHVQVVIWIVRGIVKLRKIYKEFKWPWRRAAMDPVSTHSAGECIIRSNSHNSSLLVVSRVLETLALYKVGPSTVPDTLYFSILVHFVHPLLFIRH